MAHSKKHVKRQEATSSGTPTNNEKLPADMEDLKVKIKQLQTTTAALQTSVESLERHIKKMQDADERYQAFVKMRLLEEYLFEQAAPAGTKTRLEHLPTPEEAARAIVEDGDEHYIVIFKRLYGSSPHLYL
ncbi:hypothetical protein DVH05_007404 [Phytophthora capsici]|nr:hypothetical protein DVH05_007404 [Phytophthora capsici]